MENEIQDSVLTGIFRRGYERIFSENWPTWLGGILIGILSVITFAWARPWGVAGGLRNWSDWFLNVVGIYQQEPLSPLISTSSILTLGLLIGALGSALMSKQFAIRMAPPLELVKGIVGGIFMGVGSAMAGGCNVGGFFSSLSALSLSGFAMMIGLFVGAYLGLRYLYWELEHIPQGSKETGPEPPSEKGFDWLRVEPYIGAAVFLGALIWAWIYAQHAYTRIGVLLLCGVGFGLIIQRTRFCFVRGFRDPFMTGEGEMSRGIAISLIISILGFSAIKWAGLRGEDVYVAQAFWFGALVGGIIFGIGMVLAGGCGSGSVWRAGEGQVKLILAVIFFSLSMSLFETWIESSKIVAGLMGYRVFLPDFLTFRWTVILLILLMLAYYVAATWNEETDRFTVEM